MLLSRYKAPTRWDALFGGLHPCGMSSLIICRSSHCTSLQPRWQHNASTQNIIWPNINESMRFNDNPCGRCNRDQKVEKHQWISMNLCSFNLGTVDPGISALSEPVSASSHLAVARVSKRCLDSQHSACGNRMARQGRSCATMIRCFWVIRLNNPCVLPKQLGFAMAHG